MKQKRKIQTQKNKTKIKINKITISIIHTHPLRQASTRAPTAADTRETLWTARCTATACGSLRTTTCMWASSTMAFSTVAAAGRACRTTCKSVSVYCSLSLLSRDYFLILFLLPPILVLLFLIFLLLLLVIVNDLVLSHAASMRCATIYIYMYVCIYIFIHLFICFLLLLACASR